MNVEIVEYRHRFRESEKMRSNIENTCLEKEKILEKTSALKEKRVYYLKETNVFLFLNKNLIV